ncbi:MAG: NAD-dependent deacylase [Spirochaetes bacterium]|nr:NAD-dependent deacylase [Spirochaetota bacterium]
MESIKDARSIISKSHYLAALTGAGISAGSGIPAFRGRGGLWQVYDPALARIDVFRDNPHLVWDMTRELIALIEGSEPNPAHRALAEMERGGVLKGLVTQNIDNLHQRAGSRSIIELHGTIGNLRCLTCNTVFNSADFKIMDEDPLCPHCSAVLKPGMVFFGEALPFGALMEARLLAGTADAMLIIGTSAVVNPAAELPVVAKGNRAKIIEINIEPTGLTNSITDVFIRGRAEEVLPDLLGTMPPHG